MNFLPLQVEGNNEISAQGVTGPEGNISDLFEGQKTPDPLQSLLSDLTALGTPPLVTSPKQEMNRTPSGPGLLGANQMKPVNCEDLERELMNTTSPKSLEPPTGAPIYTTQGQFPDPPKVQRMLSAGAYSRIAHSDQYLALSDADRQKLSGFSVDAPEFVPRVITPTKFDLTAPPGAPPGSMPEVTVTVAPIQTPSQPVSAATPLGVVAPVSTRGEITQPSRPSQGPSPQALAGLPTSQAGLPPTQAGGPPPPVPPPPPPIPQSAPQITGNYNFTYDH